MPQRFQFTLRTALLAMVLVGLLMGLVGRAIRLNQLHRAAQQGLTRRHHETFAAYARAREKIGEPLRNARSYGGGATFSWRHFGLFTESSWRDRIRVGRKPRKDSRRERVEVFLEVEVRAVVRNGRFEPIVIYDSGAEHNPVLLDELSEVYRAHRWPYRIVSTDPEPDQAD